MLVKSGNVRARSLPLCSAWWNSNGQDTSTGASCAGKRWFESLPSWFVWKQRKRFKRSRPKICCFLKTWPLNIILPPWAANQPEAILDDFAVDKSNDVHCVEAEADDQSRFRGALLRFLVVVPTEEAVDSVQKFGDGITFEHQFGHYWKTIIFLWTTAVVLKIFLFWIYYVIWMY